MTLANCSPTRISSSHGKSHVGWFQFLFAVETSTQTVPRLPS
jgi:hypothetical protein